MISKEECIKYQKDIDRMYRNRRIFLSIGLPLLLSFVVLIPLAIIYYKNSAFSDAMITLSVIFFIVGLVLLILRSALFNHRIRARKRLVEEAKNELEIDRLYSDHERNKNSKS